MKKTTMTIALVGALTLASAGCTGASGAGGSSGGEKPQPQTSYCSVFATNCGAQPTRPVVSADAAPQGEASGEPVLSFGDCSIDMFPAGLGLVAGADLVLATAHNYCRIQPYSASVIMSIQTCDKVVCVDSDFKDDPQSFFTDYRLPPEYPDYHLLHTDSDCKAGVHYRVFFKVWGVGAIYQNGNKLPGVPFGSKSKPITKAGPALTYSASECSGR